MILKTNIIGNIKNTLFRPRIFIQKNNFIFNLFMKYIVYKTNYLSSGEIRFPYYFFGWLSQIQIHTLILRKMIFNNQSETPFCYVLTEASLFETSYTNWASVNSYYHNWCHSYHNLPNYKAFSIKCNQLKSQSEPINLQLRSHNT